MNTTPKSICLATSEFKGFVQVGGIGSYFDQLARLLSNNDWQVSVLVHEPRPDFDQIATGYRQETGIPIYNAEYLCREAGLSTIEIKKGAFTRQAASHIFHEALQVLIKKYQHEFDLIEFPDYLAPGFIPIREHKNCRAYGNSGLIVKLHGPGEWGRESCRQEWTTSEDLKLDYMERYCFENADIQVSPTKYLLKWAEEHGWKINRADVCTNPIESLQNIIPPALKISAI